MSSRRCTICHRGWVCRVRLNENHWQLLREGVVVAWTDGTKTRLDTCVPLDFDKTPEISVDMRLEKLKNSHVVISGSAPEQMLARLERRVAMLPDTPLLAVSG